MTDNKASQPSRPRSTTMDEYNAKQAEAEGGKAEVKGKRKAALGKAKR